MSLRAAGVILLLAAGGMAWLTEIEQRSSAALWLVEHSGPADQPLYVWFGLAGLLAVAIPRRRPSARPAAVKGGRRPSRPPTRGPRAAPSSDLPDDLRADLPADLPDDLEEAAAALPLDPGVNLAVDLLAPSPLTLEMSGLTPGRVRRNLIAFAGLLARHPELPRVAIRFHDCPAGTTPRHHQVAGALATTIPRGRFRVVSQQDGVDVLFG